MKLTAKQEKFCNEYLINLNATQAAIRAGYSEKTAAVIGAENLIKPNIANFIQERQKELQEETGITQKRVLEEYAKIAFSDIRQMFDGNNMLLSLKDVPDDIAACLSSVEVDQLWGASMDSKVQIGETKKVKVWNKINALDSLARHFGMFEKDNEQSKPVVHISGMEIK